MRAKHFEYAISLDRVGRIAPEGDEPLELGDPWSPEALLLAALAQCSVASLGHFARQRNIDVVASARASGRVTQREDEDRYGFVEIECRIDLELEPAPPRNELLELLSKAEWGCFVGASLRPAPTYRWRVNGEDV